VFEMNQ